MSNGAGGDPIDLVRQLLDAVLELERLLRVRVGLGPVAVPLVRMYGDGFVGLCGDLLHRAASVLLELHLALQPVQLRARGRSLDLPTRRARL